MAAALTRRQALGVFTALSAALLSAPALAREAVQGFMEEMMAAGPGTADWLQLDAPEEAENANAVRVSVAVAPPAELGIRCEEVLLVVERNPRPAACHMSFSASAVPDFTVNIRLAESQDVVALARMSDGSVVMARKPVTLTAGGCGL